MVSLNRRVLMGGAAMAALSAPMLMVRAAQADAPKAADRAAPPETHRFKVGGFEVTVIKDGARPSGAPNETFGLGEPPRVVSELLEQNFLPTDQFVNSFAPVLVNTGSEVVLFDTGLGAAGREGGGGRLLEGLKAAGYAPEDVSIVVLTHMHGDHIGGLMEDGKPAFANARYIAGQREYDFWVDPARVGTPAEGGQKGVLTNVKPLAEKTTFIAPGADVVSGITAIEAFGHSPGHMIYNLESDGKRLVLTADTANHFVLSLQRPDWEVKFDMDKPAAAAARAKVFDMIAADKLAFLGYHMPFPATGYVEKRDGGYRFVPKAYQFDI